MGSILASALISRISETVQDESNVVWTVSQALSWLNDAQLQIVLQRPDASILNHSVTLVPGTKQAITGLRFMSAVRNMGVDGSTPGRAIRLVERGIKDDFDPDWHTETAATEVKEYIFDARLPKEFYVSPPVHASTVVQIEVSEAVNPTDIATTSDVITLEDIYSPIMIEWAIYRCLAREAEETPNIQRAAMHFQNFFTMLGVKMNPDIAINPKMREHLK